MPRPLLAALLLAVVLVTTHRFAATIFAAEHTKDSLDTVKAGLKEKKAMLVDVREPKEWDAGHLQDARTLPLSDLKKGVEAEKLVKLMPKDKIIYLHCAAGGRCLTAADILKKEGYDVRPLKPGYDDLLKAGFEKAKPEKKEK